MLRYPAAARSGAVVSQAPQIAVAATSRVDTGHTVYVGGTDYLTVGG
ncbi:hypothetical protein ACWDKQ_31910 [Saccharopolyspora sp. NPDC000995]